jgi:hypothetical protein
VEEEPYKKNLCVINLVKVTRELFIVFKIKLLYQKYTNAKLKFSLLCQNNKVFLKYLLITGNSERIFFTF